MPDHDLDVSAPAMIVAPEVGDHRCKNCKHQGMIVPDFVDPVSRQPQKLCLEGPATVTPVFQFQIGPQVPGGFQGGVVRHVSYPPAPDHWTCFRWKPRLATS